MMKISIEEDTIKIVLARH